MRDFLHQIVKNALLKDGWLITHDPFPITFGNRRVYADLGAEKLLAAEKEGQKIVVEVKSFVGLSAISELQKAIGQYAMYRSWLQRTEPDWIIYIALDQIAFADLFEDISGQVLLTDYDLKIMVVDASLGEIVKWIK